MFKSTTATAETIEFLHAVASHGWQNLIDVFLEILKNIFQDFASNKHFIQRTYIARKPIQTVEKIVFRSKLAASPTRGVTYYIHWYQEVYCFGSSLQSTKMFTIHNLRWMGNDFRFVLVVSIVWLFLSITLLQKMQITDMLLLQRG